MSIDGTDGQDEALAQELRHEAEVEEAAAAVLASEAVALEVDAAVLEAEADALEHPEPIFHFTVDGVHHETHERELTADQILRLAGLDPVKRYLEEVEPEDRSFKEDGNERIVMVHHMAFVSLNRGPTPTS